MPWKHQAFINFGGLVTLSSPEMHQDDWQVTERKELPCKACGLFSFLCRKKIGVGNESYIFFYHKYLNKRYAK